MGSCSYRHFHRYPHCCRHILYSRDIRLCPPPRTSADIVQGYWTGLQEQIRKGQEGRDWSIVQVGIEQTLGIVVQGTDCFLAFALPCYRLRYPLRELESST